MILHLKIWTGRLKITGPITSGGLPRNKEFLVTDYPRGRGISPVPSRLPSGNEIIYFAAPDTALGGIDLPEGEVKSETPTHPDRYRERGIL